MCTRSIAKIIIAMLLVVMSTSLVQAQYRYTFRDSLGVYKVEFTPHKRGVSDAKRMSIPVSVGAHEIR